MKEGQRLWTKDELILAINLYCKLPFGKMHKGNTQIIELAELIDRSPSSIARKLGNFASFDPTLRARGIRGLTATSKLDEEVWNEFYNDWENRLIASEHLLAKAKGTTIDKINNIDFSDLPKEGKEKERIVKTRVNQSLFRTMILATYNGVCCITGINQPELLVASHIVPWSKDKMNRLNPMNGIALNALHDKAFDSGLITITPDYKIRVSNKFNNVKKDSSANEFFLKYDKQEITLPDKFLPAKEFLEYHNETIFRK